MSKTRKKINRKIDEVNQQKDKRSTIDQKTLKNAKNVTNISPKMSTQKK